MAFEQCLSLKNTSLLYTTPRSIPPFAFHSLDPNVFRRSASTGRIKCSFDYYGSNSAMSYNNGPYEYERAAVAGHQYPRPEEIQWKKELCNSVQLIGVVGTPVQIKQLPSGKVVAWSRLAVKKSQTDKSLFSLYISLSLHSSPMAFSFAILKFLAFFSLFSLCIASRPTPNSLVEDDQNQLLKYHKGALLNGRISVNLIWYGKFKPSQRAIVADFITSLTPSTSTAAQTTPSVAAWWKMTEKYYNIAKTKKASSLTLSLGKQILDDKYSLGKSLSEKQIVELASKGDKLNAINVVLTASDVTVDGFCVNRCGSHGSKSTAVKGKNYRFAYIWVGNSEKQCPGYCAWPFHQPIYGPQNPPLVAPNNDIGIDGMLISLSGLLAGTATNPFGNGFYQGPAGAPLEAATACPGVYAKGAYPGYAGDLLVDSTTGASYNANGANGRKYLLPAIYDPSTSKCSTLV